MTASGSWWALMLSGTVRSLCNSSDSPATPLTLQLLWLLCNYLSFLLQPQLLGCCSLYKDGRRILSWNIGSVKNSSLMNSGSAENCSLGNIGSAGNCSLGNIGSAENCSIASEHRFCRELFASEHRFCQDCSLLHEHRFCPNCSLVNIGSVQTVP